MIFLEKSKFYLSLVVVFLLASAAQNIAVAQSAGGYAYWSGGEQRMEPDLYQACLKNLEVRPLPWALLMPAGENIVIDDVKHFAMETGDASNGTCKFLDTGPKYVGMRIFAEVPWACPSGFYSENRICKVDPDKGHNNSDKCEASSNNYVGNPVSLASASKEEDVVDFETNGPHPLILRRLYRARSQPGNMLGDSRWRFDFEYEMMISTVGADIYTPEGEHYHFVQDNLGNFSLPAGEGPVSLTNTANGRYEIVLHSGTKIAMLKVVGGDAYRVVSITKPDGHLMRVDYSGSSIDDRITKISDDALRQIHFIVDQAGNVIEANAGGTVFVPSVYKINYTYSGSSAQGRILSSVSRYFNSGIPGAANWGLVDSVTYHYENSVFNFLLTGITDERGIRYSTWTYDSTARPLSSVHAGSVDYTAIAYNDAPFTRTVTNPLGRITNYSFNPLNGRMLGTTTVSQSSANAPASQRSVTYDINGNISTEIDEEGRVTSYVRDS